MGCPLSPIGACTTGAEFSDTPLVLPLLVDVEVPEVPEVEVEVVAAPLVEDAGGAGFVTTILKV
jgi:hypothetical protein